MKVLPPSSGADLRAVHTETALGVESPLVFDFCFWSLEDQMSKFLGNLEHGQNVIMCPDNFIKIGF